MKLAVTVVVDCQRVALDAAVVSMRGASERASEGASEGSRPRRQDAAAALDVS